MKGAAVRIAVGAGQIAGRTYIQRYTLRLRLGDQVERFLTRRSLRERLGQMNRFRIARIKALGKIGWQLVNTAVRNDEQMLSVARADALEQRRANVGGT